MAYVLSYVLWIIKDLWKNFCTYTLISNFKLTRKTIKRELKMNDSRSIQKYGTLATAVKGEWKWKHRTPVTATKGEWNWKYGTPFTAAKEGIINFFFLFYFNIHFNFRPSQCILLTSKNIPFGASHTVSLTTGVPPPNPGFNICVSLNWTLLELYYNRQRRK